MTIVRLGYVAMSMELKNASPSKTMTYTQFQKIEDKEAAIRELERIALKNLENTLRLLRHNVASDIHFYRFSSRLVPLATHEALKEWNYIKPLKEALQEIGEFVHTHGLRVDFHPDHFVLINSQRKEVLENSLINLNMHHSLLENMGIDPIHRCVLHVGGKYNDKEKSLARFIDNWQLVPSHIQKMLMLENDDTCFTLEDTLYVCKKLNVPLVFDYHHHLVNHEQSNWESDWDLVIQTWKNFSLPIKMHISSPKSDKSFRHHADYIDIDMFFDFLNKIKGSVPQIDCMIEEKRKDEALFKLVDEVKKREGVEVIDGASFSI